ncbi:AAA family ATPase [Ktedonobacter racemifer]|uniref:Transcriptional regulator, SARP family n=1 Tax=Ktedonobacter racemifer DSM 44963 TaxID=485913 RepID=D6TML0_KTERA|nr:AAA family ATPase [Ktedonobacter racemifer]EFH87010.1 transcriptional regulator, SARP family [Ktedonobacter racemifer DSM 44963]
MKDAANRNIPLVRIYLLGQCRLERWHSQGWEAVSEVTWQQRRVRSLFACMVNQTSRMMGREQLMEALWPELDVDTSANRLNIAVHGLRQVLEPELERPANSQLLRLEHDIFMLAQQGQVWVDADAFEEWLRLAYAAQDAQSREHLLLQAAQLYNGEFLAEERTLSWAQARRSTLQRKWIGLLLMLSDVYEARSAWLEEIEVLERLIAVDPAHEAAVRRLMHALVCLERPAEAARAYQCLVTKLAKLYGIEPLAETRQLYASVCKKMQALSMCSSPLSALAQPISSLRSGMAPHAFSEHVFLARTPSLARTTWNLKDRASRPELVGREQEYEALCRTLHSLQQAPSLTPHMFLLTGEAGMGKTHLAEEVSQYAQELGWVVLWNKVLEEQCTTPYHAWLDVLRLLRESELLPQHSETRTVNKNSQTQVLSRWQREYVTLAAVEPLLREQECFSLREDLLKWLDANCGQKPLLIVFDDAHWFDRESIELLCYLVRRLCKRPIAVMVTCLTAELMRNRVLQTLIADLRRDQLVQPVPLQALEDGQIEDLLAHVPSSLVADIKKQVGGNPFLAWELAAALGRKARSLSQRSAGDSQVILPRSIAAILEQRFCRLSLCSQRLLRKCARLGSAFTWQQVLQLGAEYDEDAILDVLEESLQAGLLAEDGMGGAIHYEFRPPLLACYLAQCHD